MRTDADGLARAGVGKGEYSVRLSVGTWDEEQIIRVGSAEPVAVKFHRDWVGPKRVTGRLLLGGFPLLAVVTFTAHVQRRRGRTSSRT